MQGKKDLTKTAFFVMIATLISKILGFMREVLLGSTYGATYMTDAYLIAITIPTILFSSIIAAIATTFIPVYSRVTLEGGQKENIKFTNKILNAVIVVCSVFSIFGLIFTRPIVSIIAIGFDEATFDLAVELTRIVFPMILFIGVAYIFTGFLQSNGEFAIPALINVPNNIIIIVVLLFSSAFGIHGLAYATLFGSLFQVVIQFPYAIKKGFRYKYILDFKDQYVQNIWILAIPVLIGASVQQLNALVDRMLASGLIEGSISALNFANKLNGFVFGIFSISISTVIYPLLATLNVQNNKTVFRKTLVSSINVITILMIPMTAGAIILRVPIVSILFQRGEFDSRATMLTASALLFYSLGMVFFGYRDILSRVFYSLNDTKTPMINGVIALICNILLNIILVQYMQHAGLAFATSITAAITTILLFISLKKKLGSIGTISIVKVFIKSCIATIIMGVTVYNLNIYINSIIITESITSKLLTLSLNIGVGVIIYSTVIYFSKIDEISWIIGLVKNKLNLK